MGEIFSKNTKRNILLLSVIFFMGSFFYLRYLWNISKSETAIETIKKAELAASGFSPDSLEKLSFSEEDLTKREYQDLKDNLVKVKNADYNISFSYILIKKDEKIYFVSDSEPQDSEDYSPPGQEYTEATEQEFKPFKTGNTLLTTPATDRWGTWVSVLVPMKDKTTGEIKAVFGIDYSAQKWTLDTINVVSRSGITLLSSYLILLTFVMLLLNSRKTRETEKNFSTFFETITDIVVVVNAEGVILYANDAMTSALGYTPKELIGNPVDKLISKETKGTSDKLFTEILSGKRTRISMPLRKKDNTILLAEANIWKGQWNGKDSIFGLIKDVSQEQELLQKFNQIFENNPNVMALSKLPGNELSTQRVITEVNKAFINTFGYTEQEILGKMPEDLNIYVDKEQKAFKEALKETGEINNVNAQVKTKNGEIIEGLFSGTIINTQGSYYLLLTMINQTTTKKTRDDLVKKMGELERLNKIMVERELKMVELKKEIDKLKEKTK